jgi:hypothetical protein
MDSNSSKLDSNSWNWTVTVGNWTVIVQSWTVTVENWTITVQCLDSNGRLSREYYIYKNIKELSHTNTCTLRY